MYPLRSGPLYIVHFKVKGEKNQSAAKKKSEKSLAHGMYLKLEEKTF